MEDTYTIEQYIKGELKGKALDDFNERLQNDPDFAADVKISQAIHGAVKKKNIDFLDTLKQVDKEYHANPEPALEPKSVTNIRFLRPLLVAASVLLLIGLGWWLIRGDDTADNLFADNFKIHKYVEMSGGDCKEGYLDCYLNKGTKELETGNYEEAIRQFDRTLNSKNIKDYPKEAAKAHWYKALAYLKKGELSNSEKEITVVIDQYPDFLSDVSPKKFRKRLRQLMNKK